MSELEEIDKTLSGFSSSRRVMSAMANFSVNFSPFHLSAISGFDIIIHYSPTRPKKTERLSGFEPGIPRYEARTLPSDQLGC